jgi:hypothetical protein
MENKLPVVVSTASFNGTIYKRDFYVILEHIDKLKQEGFVFEKHERIDAENEIIYDYVLCLYKK